MAAGGVSIVSSPQQYTRVDVFVNSVLLMEEATVEINRKSNRQVVKSVQKDWAGTSEGAKELDIKITSGVPTAGFELDPGKYIKTGLYVTIQLGAAGKVLSSTGSIMDDSLSGGVGQESKLSFSFSGSYSDWE